MLIGKEELLKDCKARPACKGLQTKVRKASGVVSLLEMNECLTKEIGCALVIFAVLRRFEIVTVKVHATR